MAVALVLNGVLLAGLVVLAIRLLLEGAWPALFFLACFAAIGAFSPAERGRRSRRRRRQPSKRDLDRVDGAVHRLCFLADLPAPRYSVAPDHLALAWTVEVPWRAAELSVTTALLDQLSDAELEAVIAHELSHLAHRDAALMTVLAGPGILILRGVRQMWRERGEDPRNALAAILFGSYAVPLGLVLVSASRIVSRHRELAADRGAAVLTGSPSSLAAALLRLSGQLERMPHADLRAVAPRDPLHVLPARASEPRGLRRLWATHPRLAARLAQLERLESAMQRGA